LESLDPKNDKMETCGFSGEGILSRERDAVPTMVLGTAQLGLDYGVSNKTGKPRPEEALEIVKRGWDGGIRYFDTAQAYGESEAVLGECFREMNKRVQDFDPRIISKLNPDIDPMQLDVVIKEIKCSLKRLGAEKLWGFMLHRESFLDIDEQTLSEVISDFKKESRFKYFGISVYSPGYALRALRIDGIDFVQIPYNVFDQRAERHGVFDLASKRGKQVFVRSIYLQGLLLMDPTELGEAWVFSKVPLKTFAQCASSIGVSRKLLALAFVAQTAPQAMLVIGAETPDQVSENLDMLKEAERVSIPEIAQLSSNDPMLINPSLWQQ